MKLEKVDDKSDPKDCLQQLKLYFTSMTDKLEVCS